METDFIPIDYDHFDFEDRNYIKIFGRNSKNQRICVIDTCPIYLWAIIKDSVSQEKINKLIEKIKDIELDVKGRKTKVEKIEIHEKNFLDKKVRALKIFATNYKDLHDVADRLDFPEIQCRRGYDLGFDTHYIIEKRINPLQWYKISGEVLNNSQNFGGVDSNLDVDFCIKLDSAKKIDNDLGFKPKVMAYDIETDDIKLGEGEILMVSLVTDSFKKVITWKKPKTSEKNLDFLEFVKDEADLIEKFLEYVKKFSPDFLVGYFSDGFDLPYMKMRAEKNNIRLSIGLDSSQPRFSRGFEVTAKTKGIVHVDLLKFIRTAYSQYMQSETLSLNEVAHEFLGDEKKPFKHQHSSKLTDSNWESYFEYNLHDSVLVYGLFEKMWPDILEFSRVMHEPTSEVTRNGMSKNVESFILHNLEKFNEIPEKRPTNEEIGQRRGKEKYEGAFVFEPTHGLYENVAVFDFTSSYGSTIVTYNLSKSTFIDDKKSEKDSYNIEIQGKKVSFSKKPGFFPEMLKEIIEKRKKFKEELNKKPDVIKRARSNAFKLLANASYGYQGFFGARYYSREAAAATAAFAKKSIRDSIEKIDKSGYKVIYSDTDSIAFLIENHTEEQAKKLLEKLNSELPGIMELELEGFFTRGLWVTKRSGTLGAKKKYALLGKDNKLKIRGFETVRRDWCSLARKTQNEVIRMVLQDGNERRALDFIKKVIQDLKQRKIQREEIIIKTMLQKPLAEYKAISPHVIAAQKMQEKEIPIGSGNMIEYFIAETREKKKLVRDKVKLPDEKGEYNIEYYLNKQILPAVENILQVFNINIHEMIDGKKQTKLGDF
ncbi:MAG: DNA-directed DNA polymerase [Candidatus Pacearchaeota archaeon]|jgi:DNA polymerase I/DNA polymerase-2